MGRPARKPAARAVGERDAPRELPAAVTGLLVAAQELLGSFGRSEPLTQACRITRTVLDADMVVAFRTPDGGGTFRSQTQYGLTEEMWAAYQVIELPDDISVRIAERLRHDDVSMIDVAAQADTPEDQERRHIARKMGLGPILLLALRTDGALTGVMVACRDASRERFDETALRVATAFGPLLSASLENQRLLQALETAHQAQGEFLASMSHELRTPLNVIAGYLDMLLDGLAGTLNPQQREICERIRRSATLQLSLVGEAFEISRRDREGRIPARREEIALASFVADLERETGLRAVTPEVGVVWTVRDIDLPVVSDPVKLRMIVRNLVDNAIKFTRHGHVHIHVSLDDETLTWRIEDTGVGIADAEREAIFDAFRQVGGCSTGLGLGLHIVRRLTDALGGTVEVESAVGRGSTFTVHVPVEVVAVADETGSR